MKCPKCGKEMQYNMFSNSYECDFCKYTIGTIKPNNHKQTTTFGLVILGVLWLISVFIVTFASSIILVVIFSFVKDLAMVGFIYLLIKRISLNCIDDYHKNNIVSMEIEIAQLKEQSKCLKRNIDEMSKQLYLLEKHERKDNE